MNDLSAPKRRKKRKRNPNHGGWHGRAPTEKQIQHARVAAFKHGRRAKMLTTVEIAGAVMKRDGAGALSEQDGVLMGAILQSVYEDDISAMKPVLAASIFNSAKQLFAADKKISEDGITQTRAVLDSDGKAHEFEVEHPAVRTKFGLMDRLGLTAEAAMLTRKARAEGEADESFKKTLDQMRDLFGDRNQMAAPLAIEAEKVPN